MLRHAIGSLGREGRDAVVGVVDIAGPEGGGRRRVSRVGGGAAAAAEGGGGDRDGDAHVDGAGGGVGDFDLGAWG